MSISPTLEGFRAAFRRPSFTLAEIVWRWAVGATATTLLAFGVSEYLGTLPVTNGELLFLRTRHPYLVGEAIAHILRGSLNRAVMSTLLAALLLMLLWVVAASLGRLATVRGLLDYFRRDVADHVSAGAAENEVSSVSVKESFRTLTRLNFLRAALALAALLGFVSASILASLASPAVQPRPALAVLVFLSLAVLICCSWSSLNWLLSLASVFAVRDGEDAVNAISASVSFCRERAGAVSAVSTWAGLAHLIAFVAAWSVISIPMGFVAIVQWRLVVAVMILATLVYLAVADWLYIARLAGYVCIAEMPEEMLAPPIPRIQTTIDRDEPILSDVPGILPASS
jgi:hypothetical protein